jgi:hypothetical protein
MLLGHSYLTLFSRDPDSLLDLGPMHQGVSSKRIDVIVLEFRNAELAAREVTRMKEKAQDNIGTKVIRSSANGFEVKTALKSYVALRHGTRVASFETRGQEDVMRSIAYRLQQAEW